VYNWNLLYDLIVGFTSLKFVNTRVAVRL